MNTKKKSASKWLILVLALCFYFCVLIIVSYLRAPEQNRRELIERFSSSDFSEIEGMTGNYHSDVRNINLENEAGLVSGICTEIPLAGVEEIQVSFYVRSDQNTLGSILVVDLCAPDYDRQEQEQWVSIDQKGKAVSVLLKPGSDAPQYAFLRVFTTDRLSCVISDLEVCLWGQTTFAVFYAVGAIALLLLGLIVLFLIRSGIDMRFFMLKGKKGQKHDNALAGFFLVIIFAPLCVNVMSKCIDKRIDTQLSGNFATNTKVELSAQTFLDGSFQKYFETKWDDTFGLHGVVIKTYNQLRYSLFGEGTRIIGKDGSVFEPLYIYTQLGYPEEYSCDSEDNKRLIEQYVERLNAISKKLEACGKHLIVYTTPSKADFDYDAIPARFFVGRDDTAAVSPVEYFRTLRDQGTFQFAYLDSTEAIRAQDPDYPVFYKTGIHWSRPAEQFVSQQLTKILQEQMGEKTVQLQLGELQSSESPYWRDADVYELLNIWKGKKDATYYEYATSTTQQDGKRLNVLLMGGSFAMGFERDLVELGISQTVQYLNYDYGIGVRFLRTNQNDNDVTMFTSMQDLRLQTLLDGSDVVLIECNESVLLQRSAQDIFVEYLETFLDTYKPDVVAVERVEFPENQKWNPNVFKGFYPPEETHVWSEPSSCFLMCNSEIHTKGLELEVYIPFELAASGQSLSISVNGALISEIPLSKSGIHLIKVPSAQVPVDNYQYLVEFSAGDSFNPKDMGIADDRDLSFSLLYAGEGRETK